MPHAMRPDGDNFEKFTNDALNGILWEDDSQIVWCLRSKTYINDLMGEIVIKAMEIPNDRPDYEALIEEITSSIRIEPAYLGDQETGFPGSDRGSEQTT